MVRVVCAVIENAQGLILATRRPPEKSFGGKWEFPGGKLFAGESPQDALVREIGEELGIQILVGEKLTDSAWDEETIRIHLIPFRATITNGDIVLNEHTEARWLRRTQLSLLDWAPADIPIVDEVVNTH